jgi:hypothetical protein
VKQVMFINKNENGGCSFIILVTVVRLVCSFVYGLFCVGFSRILRTLIDCTFFDRRQIQRHVWRELIHKATTVF